MIHCLQSCTGIGVVLNRSCCIENDRCKIEDNLGGAIIDNRKLDEIKIM
jgi:hypothetical protein